MQPIKMHCTCRLLIGNAFYTQITRQAAIPPAFLLPAFSVQHSHFSTSITQQARKDGNRSRGVSALRRTGLNRHQKISVRLDQLPKPVLDRSKRSSVEVEETHGLWDFFPAERTAMPLPEDLAAHGRAWTVPELRKKDWTDLHMLWWTCIKEINRLKTYQAERDRIGNLYGRYESESREKEVSVSLHREESVTA